ncbi:MAG: CPBP family intramembrane metalloprotease [Mycobacteriaceae bacterium]|nr:CPBP family intramembrane metalloprotease [Mycobacteriaceae bacterium]
MTELPERTALRLEIAVVLTVTFGLSGLSAALSLTQSALGPGGLSGHTVSLNQSRSKLSILDLLWQLLDALQLFGWAGLALYLLWRGGVGPKAIGLGRPRPRPDGLASLALAALIGLPGLALYLVAHRLGLAVTVVPSSLQDHWWRPWVLILAAFANAVAEEVVVVGFLLQRLRKLGWSDDRALAASALLRGSYHLYQGVGGGLGNLVMGLVFGRYWQRNTRLWPLVLAHATIDAVAYIGYPILHKSVSWLP